MNIPKIPNGWWVLHPRGVALLSKLEHLTPGSLKIMVYRPESDTFGPAARIVPGNLYITQNTKPEIFFALLMSPAPGYNPHGISVIRTGVDYRLLSATEVFYLCLSGKVLIDCSVWDNNVKRWTQLPRAQLDKPVSIRVKDGSKIKTEEPPKEAKYGILCAPSCFPGPADDLTFASCPHCHPEIL